MSRVRKLEDGFFMNLFFVLLLLELFAVVSRTRTKKKRGEGRGSE